MTALAERILSVVDLAAGPRLAIQDVAVRLALDPDVVSPAVSEIAQHLYAAEAIRREAPFTPCPHRHPHCIEPGCERAAVLTAALTETGLAIGAAEALATIVAELAA